MKLIDREALRRKRPFTIRGGDLSEYTEGYIDCAMDAEEAIKNEPTVDAAPVVHGRWVFDAESYEWNCSECHDWPIDGSADDERTYYCPNCGAKMDLED